MQEPLKLYTFEISHFSEKIRWCLDVARVPYEEVVWTPAFHIARALRKTRRKTTVPIVETAREVVQDSTDILLWLERERSPFPLIPEDRDERSETLAIEERFDRVGTSVLRHAYGAALEVPGAVPELWRQAAGPVERWLLPLIFPAIVPRFRRVFRIDPEGLARAHQVITEGIGWLDERLADGRRYLVGGRLTVADITAAALLAPLACPEEHPMYGTARFRDLMAPAARPFGVPRAFDWVRDRYRHDRRPR